MAMKKLVDKIHRAKSILLSTHRQCDGDGLGAQLALYHALKKLGKNVRALNVDSVPGKYKFLHPEKYVQSFDDVHDPVETTDLALIMDTNDKRLLEPLYPTLEKHCKEIVFVDHHPILSAGPSPTPSSFIDTKAASTGEITYRILKELEAPFDAFIARALYTSIVFDTQLFRYVRNSPASHLIAADLLTYECDPAEVHRFLFANHKVEKFKFLASVLDQMEYFENSQLALLKINAQSLENHGMSLEDSRDLIDLLMNVESLVAAAMIIEVSPTQFKVSIRSKGAFEVRAIAELLGGGGHMFASGATVELPYAKIRSIIVSELTKLVKASP